MGYLSERVNYLRGFADGLKIDKDTDMGKLLNLIIDVIDDIAISVEENEDTQNEILDSVDEIDERLSDVEECLDGDCDCCDDETEYAEVECPNCGAEIELDEAVIADYKGVIICPNCEEEIQIEWVDDCDDDGCCCGHEHHKHHDHDHGHDHDHHDDEEYKNGGHVDGNICGPASGLEKARARAAFLCGAPGGARLSIGVQ